MPLAACWLLLTGWLFAYPLVERGDAGDPVFAQLQQEIRANHRRAARGTALLPFQFYRYCGKERSLIALAATLNLPYETVATVNGWQHFSDFNPTSCLWVANSPGIAVPAGRRNRWEQQLFDQRRERKPLTVRLADRVLLFYPFSVFSRRERLLFLSAPFVPPLDGELDVTSHYGWRAHPFGRQQGETHRGLDLRSQDGSPVYTVADGRVFDFGRDPVYGLHLLIDHGRGLITLYGHLSKVLIGKGDVVLQGQKIALSGHSGRVTGPHLHFGAFRDRKSVDPSPYLGLSPWPR